MPNIFEMAARALGDAGIVEVQLAAVHRELLARVGGQEPLGLGVVALEHLGLWSRARHECSAGRATSSEKSNRHRYSATDWKSFV